MNKTQQLLKEREERFEKLFEDESVVKLQVGIFKSDVQINVDALKSFHATTISLLINSLKEETGKLPRYDVYDGGEAESEDGDYFKVNEVLTFLSETISNIQTK